MPGPLDRFADRLPTADELSVMTSDEVAELLDAAEDVRDADASEFASLKRWASRIANAARRELDRRRSR